MISSTEARDPSRDVIARTVEIWRDLFGDQTIGPEADFFGLGGDSMKATALMVHVQEQFGIVLDPIEIFDAPSLREFAEVVASNLPLGNGQNVQEQVF